MNTTAQTNELGGRVRLLFKEAGGSNSYEHNPLSFESTEEKSKSDPEQLRDEYTELFIEVAAKIFGCEYTKSWVPFHGHPEREDLRQLVIHPVGVEVKEAQHDYFFNQYAFLCGGRNELPLIRVESFDFRTAKGRDENKTTIFLRLTYGSLENKQKLFREFERVIGAAGIPYERHHPKRRLESLEFDLEFDEARNSRSYCC